MTMTLAVAPQAAALVQDLKEAVAAVRKEDPSNSKKGTAGIYGMTGSLPEGPVNELLKTFLDVGLTASMTTSSGATAAGAAGDSAKEDNQLQSAETLDTSSEVSSDESR